MQHLRWEKSGRTFTGDKPGQFVYKSSIGQQNVDLGNGQFAPYVWDKTKRIVRFADCELRFTASGLEFWHREERLNTFSFNPEAKQGLNFERKIPTVGNLAIEEIDPGNSKAELKISYKITTVDADTEVFVKAGYNHKVHFGTKFKALKDGIEQRVALEFAEKLEPVEERDRQGKILPTARLKSEKSWWAWNRAEQADHEIEQTIVTKVHLGRKVYAINEEKVISPDTWGTDVGIAANGDDGSEEITDWYDEGAFGNNLAYGGIYDVYAERIGFRWTNITVSQGATINSGLLDVYHARTPENADHSGMYWYGAKEANMSQWSSEIRPSNRTKTNAALSWAPNLTAPAWENGLNVTSIIQEIVSQGTWVSGNALGLFTDNTLTQEGYAMIEDYSHANSNEAELTITYTAGGGLSIPVARHHYQQAGGL